MTESSKISERLSSQEVTVESWTPPVEFDLSDAEHVDALSHVLDTTEVGVVDRIDKIANDLFEYENPGKKDDPEARATFVSDVKAEGEQFGRWFLFPWSQRLVHFADRDVHRDLRTSRDRNLNTYGEQQRAYKGSVFVGGLSVGSHVVDSLLLSSTGGRLILADFDEISPSNLNRHSGTFVNVGEKKLDFLAKKVSETDPYIQQVHFRDGITSGNLNELADLEPDVLVDEVDDMAVKAMLRRLAVERGIPLLMATDVGRRSVLDVERHDTDEVKPFGGRISSEDVDGLIAGALTPDDIKKLTVKIVGLRNVSARMLESVMEIDRTLPGMPQLGAAAREGGLMAAEAAREILLGRPMPSGRYVSSPYKTLNLSSPTSIPETVGVFRRFVRAQRAANATS